MAKINRDAEKEVEAIRFFKEYYPSQILMNSKNYNWTIRNYMEECKGNKALVNAGDLLLKAYSIYESAYMKVGATNYTDLESLGLSREYKEIMSKYNKEIKKAQDSVCDLFIKNGKVFHKEVYDRLLRKRDNLVKSIQNGKGPYDGENTLYNYNLYISNYENRRYNSRNLF